MRVLKSSEIIFANNKLENSFNKLKDNDEIKNILLGQ